MPKNLITENDLNAEEVLVILREAKHFKKLRRRELSKFSSRLRGRKMALLFYEPSTRTRVSFELAGRGLGIDSVFVDASSSSSAKGEGLVDEAITFSSLGFDLAVIRHPDIGAAKTFASYFEGSVINAGDGISSHPTQAIVDAFTLWERGLLRSDLVVGIVGDILNSRVARSNARLLNKFGIIPTFIAPPQFLPKMMQKNEQLVEVPGELGYQVHIVYSFESVLEKLDVVMLLRIQKERYETLPLVISEFSKSYQLNAKRLSMLRPSALIMHPGPPNRGVEIADEVFADERCVIGEQVRNGIFVRMSVLSFVLD